MAIQRPSHFLAALLSLSALAPLTAQTTCGAPPKVLQLSAPNIFSEQQEQWLGDATAERVESEYRPVKDPQLNAYLSTIGNRLLAALPPTQIQFHFLLVESSEVNGFSLAGGRVYLTRKLVASARNEDEIAGVIAHEMGHILSHQFAVETTADLHRLLGVTSVGDRADVFAKYQRLVDAEEHDKHPRNDGDSDDKQDEADRVAVYAAANAGYRPNAYAEFWDRSFFVQGKTGSNLTDFFHMTTPSQKRLRRLRGLITELPAGCGGTVDTASEAFRTWQTLVLRDQAAASDEEKPAAEVRLDPPFHTDLSHLRFSRDGKYVLAQNESSVFVLTRDPFKVLFRFDAEDANYADFSIDSQNVLFHTPSLHVEKWNIASQKLTEAHEIVSKRDCLQTLLAPDGRTLVCTGLQESDAILGLTLIDVPTGSVVFEEKSWFRPNFNMAFTASLRRIQQDDPDSLSSALSPDGNTLLVGPGDNRLAFDLRTRKPIKISGALKDGSYPISYAFIGNDKVAAINSFPADSGIFSFPEGRRLEKLKLYLGYFKSTTGGQYAITTGDEEYRSALADVHRGAYLFRTHGHSVDAFGSSVVSEGDDGTVVLRDLIGDKTSPRLATLPLSPLAFTQAVSISPNGRYLALSTRTRGAIWDTSTGKQLHLLYPFLNGWWTPDGKFLGRFSAHLKQSEQITQITMSPPKMDSLNANLDQGSVFESGHLILWKSKNGKAFDLTVKSPIDNALQWSRHYDEGRPGYTTNFGDDDLILSYPTQWTVGKDRIRADPALKAPAAAVKDKFAGRVIEIVNSADGTTRAQTVIEVPRSYTGVDDISRVGDLLYLSAGDNRTLAYSLKTGAQLRQLFGYVVSADQATGKICTSNRRDEAIVLDTAGHELLHLHLGSPLRLAELREHATQLVVLTADQRVRRFNIPSS